MAISILFVLPYQQSGYFVKQLNIYLFLETGGYTCRSLKWDLILSIMPYILFYKILLLVIFTNFLLILYSSHELAPSCS